MIHFFTNDTIEDIILQNQKLDEHFTAVYLTGPNYLDILFSPSGNLLFYSQDEEKEGRTYYQLENGSLQLL